MSQKTARRVAWSNAVFSTVLVSVGLVISILALVDSGRGVTFSHQFFTPPLTVTYCAVGALVAARHPRNPIGWIFCATGFLSALNMLSAGYALYSELVVTTRSLPGAAFARWLSYWVWLPNVLLPITFPLLLAPDGNLLSPRWRPIAWAAGLGTAAICFGMAFHPGPLKSMGIPMPNPYGLVGGANVMNAFLAAAAPVLLAGVLGSIASVVIRFRRATGQERAQLKWLAVAGVMVIVGNVLGSIPMILWSGNPLGEELSIVATDITIVSIVLAAGIAILRYRLWDIDILINRTLVYFSLTTLIAAMYVVIVGALGAVLQTESSLPVSLIATGVVAMSFQPLRERLQRGVNRLLYGERDEPYAVLGRLARRLEVVVATQAVLPTVVETVGEALKLPYVAIALREGDGFAVAAEYGRLPADQGSTEIVPLVYQSEAIGQLILALRAPHEQFSQTDWHLLGTIARQAGIAAHNVRLAQDLQRSREQLVTAREEERRRLRRDLHDGLGPALAAMSFRLDAIRNLADHDPLAVKTTASELKAQMQEALAAIRRIAYDLRPPALDELGLPGALKEHIASYSQAEDLHITLDTPERLPPLAAAVEVAIYRIALEAVTNVIRHAQASHCRVRLSLADDVCLEITDDGQGLPSPVRAGVGLSSMRERAEELGGTCTLQPALEGGTCVTAVLPLAP